MKTTLLLATLATIAASCGSARVSSGYLNLGYVKAGDKLLYRQYLYHAAIPNTIQYQDVVFRGNATTNITAIQANEVGAPQFASVWITTGGLGRNNVAIRVQSARGYGYYYVVGVWGRYTF